MRNPRSAQSLEQLPSSAEEEMCQHSLSFHLDPLNHPTSPCRRAQPSIRWVAPGVSACTCARPALMQSTGELWVASSRPFRQAHPQPPTSFLANTTTTARMEKNCQTWRIMSKSEIQVSGNFLNLFTVAQLRAAACRLEIDRQSGLPTAVPLLGCCWSAGGPKAVTKGSIPEVYHLSVPAQESVRVVSQSPGGDPKL
jgi:hypothetical protein